MKRLLLILVFSLCLVFLLASKFTSVRKFENWPYEKLKAERIEYRKVIGQIEEKTTLDGVESEELEAELQERKDHLVLIDWEIMFKKYRIDAIAAVLLLICAMLLFASFFRKKFKVKTRSRDDIIEDFYVAEEAPKEMYVDEWEFQQKIEGGFKTKKQAIDWIKSDPLLKCDYCGARFRSTMTGKKEAVQLITFYKKVPDGAEDLRVVLGTYWFTIAADELKCSGCGRVVKR